jgi:hypothetical protein
MDLLLSLGQGATKLCVEDLGPVGTVEDEKLRPALHNSCVDPVCVERASVENVRP